MSFVFSWEQTATCATYSIKWLVFTTKRKSVYSAVRTGDLNTAVSDSSVHSCYWHSPPSPEKAVNLVSSLWNVNALLGTCNTRAKIQELRMTCTACERFRYTALFQQTRLEGHVSMQYRYYTNAHSAILNAWLVLATVVYCNWPVNRLLQTS